MKTESIKLEFEKTLKESEFIGLITPSLSQSIKASALGSDETKMQWATALKGTRDMLRKRFVELARNGGLDDLKANHPAEFEKLWRAMFLKKGILTGLIQQDNALAAVEVPAIPAEGAAAAQDDFPEKEKFFTINTFCR